MIFLTGIKVLSQAEWRAPLIPEFGRQRWAVLSELKASLGYIVRPYQKKERRRLGGKEFNWKFNNYHKSDTEFCPPLEKQDGQQWGN